MGIEKSYIQIIIVSIMLTAVLFSGCTVNSPEVSGMTSPSNQNEETAGSQASISAAPTPDEILFEPVELPGPGNPHEQYLAIPKYDTETKEKFVTEAKDEILRVFPSADVSSLNNYHWDSQLAGSFFVPVIVFENVVLDKNEPDNNCTAVSYDPEKKRIVGWSLQPPVNIIKGEEKIRHEDVEIERDIIPVFKKMLGDEIYGKNKDTYFIYLADDINFPFTTRATIYESKNGVRSDMGYTEVLLSRITGEITAYGDRFNNERFLEEAVKLSPEPGISLEEAKSILERKLDELYPENPQDIIYCEYYSGDTAKGATNGLFWLDSISFLDTKDGYLLNPVPLTWRITFSTKESRSAGNPFDGAHSAYIDANSGEILYLRNSRIDIIPE